MHSELTPSINPTMDTVAVGDELPQLTVRLTRDDLVRYAGASGDFNPIHWNEKVATSVGLPDVIAHGMLTMAQAGRIVTAWVGHPGALREFGVRMTRPVVVPNDDAGAELVITGTVRAMDAETSRVTVDLKAHVAGQSVLARAQAVVVLP